jgi:hypothetical protein
MKFLGYGDQFGTKGYRMYDELTKTLKTRRDVKFQETDFDLKKSVSIPPDDSVECDDQAGTIDDAHQDRLGDPGAAMQESRQPSSLTSMHITTMLTLLMPMTT